jgi:hypothetical protein
MIAWNEVEGDRSCALCGREQPLTFHHLIPRTLHGKKWFRKRFSKEEMRLRGADLCYDCHDHIHKTYGEKELGRRFHTVESLAADEEIARFVTWVQKQR